MRLIDADYFIEYLGLDAENSREINLGEIVTLEDFDRQPTIDAEPVRHGEWILTKERNIWDEFTEVLKCSECGKFASRGQGIEVRHRYCPNCGAKMDGEREVLE